MKAHLRGGGGVKSVRFLYQYLLRKYSMNFDGTAQCSLHEELPEFLKFLSCTLLVDKIEFIIQRTEYL
jgi:hypothetical protein